jgi:hypothetical protein
MTQMGANRTRLDALTGALADAVLAAARLTTDWAAPYDERYKHPVGRAPT